VNYLYEDDKIHETKETKKSRAEADKFSIEFKKLDQRKKVKIAIGQQVSILNAWIDLDRSEVELNGHVKSKTIELIDINDDGSIDTITFDDDTRYPEKGELVNVDNKNITNTIFFADQSSAERAYTEIWFMTSRLEGQGWSIKYNLPNTLSEDESHIKMQKVPAERKYSKLEELCKEAGIVKGQIIWVRDPKTGRTIKWGGFIKAGEKFIHFVDNESGTGPDVADPKTVWYKKQESDFKPVPLIGK
jgi:hypothetical protein